MTSPLSRSLSNVPHWQQLLGLVACIVFGYLIASIATAIILIASGYGFDFINQLEPGIATAKEVSMMKTLQIIMAVSVFIIPALLFSWLKTGHRYGYLQVDQALNGLRIALVPFIWMSILPIIALSMLLNQMLELPAFMGGIEDWMRGSEIRAAELTGMFLSMDGLQDLTVNFIMVAILPAVGEELLFRGCLQRLVREWTGRPHLAIWLSAAVFSFIHFQFFGFAPRLLLGVFMGYLLYWGGSLWYPIFAHLLNNGLQVLAVYVGLQDAPTGTPPELPAMGLSEWAAMLFALLLFSTVAYVLAGIFKRGEPLRPQKRS